MAQDPLTCLILSDFNTANLAGYLGNERDAPQVEVLTPPFGQVTQVLLQKELACWNQPLDAAVVWTQPEHVIESFNQVLQYQDVPLDQLYAEVDHYASLLCEIQDRARVVLVPTWVSPSYHRGLGMLDMKAGMGITNVLMHMNLRLCDRLAEVSNMYVMDASRWMSVVGKDAFNHKLWYLGKVPFGNDVFVEAVHDIKAALRGIAGQAKKLIVLDLDDTLWGGIVGDDGWENLRLGGHDPMGEAFVDFQHALKALTRRGLLLGIVSKNDESVALEAIAQHPEMVLTLDDFIGWKINWQDKALNVDALVSEANLGLQSVVFIDDNPVERARVREALPEVLVPEWPEDKMAYTRTLLSLHCFDVPAVSQEDLARTQMYVSERKREVSKSTITSLDDWLMSLDINVTIEELNAANLQRATQLFNKTNQLNLTTRRLTESELMQWAGQENHKLWCFRVADKFGDSGLTGIISFEATGTTGTITDFVLSCRVMGRQIEETMLYTVITYAQRLGVDEVSARYLPTPKNRPCLDFWQRSGFDYDEAEALFAYKTINPYARPACIDLTGDLG